MSQEKARRIIKDAGHSFLATCVNGQPRVRPMKFVVTDDFNKGSIARGPGIGDHHPVAGPLFPAYTTQPNLYHCSPRNVAIMGDKAPCVNGLACQRVFQGI